MDFPAYFFLQPIALVQSSNTTTPDNSFVVLIIAFIAAIGLHPYLGKIWAAITAALEQLAPILKARADRQGAETKHFEQISTDLHGVLEQFTKMNDMLTQSHQLTMSQNIAYEADRKQWKSEMSEVVEDNKALNKEKGKMFDELLLLREEKRRWLIEREEKNRRIDRLRGALITAGLDPALAEIDPEAAASAVAPTTSVISVTVLPVHPAHDIPPEVNLG